MNEWFDPKVLVSIYAAVISSISLIWNICVLLQKSKKSILVKYFLISDFIPDSLIKQKKGSIYIELTNNGNTDINIKSVSLDFCRKKINFQGLIIDGIEHRDLQDLKKYPRFLRKDEIFTDEFLTKNITDFISDKLNDNDKVRITVTDALGKKYVSKTFRYKDIKNIEDETQSYNLISKSIKSNLYF